MCSRPPIRLIPVLLENVRWRLPAAGFGRPNSRGSFPIWPRTKSFPICHAGLCDRGVESLCVVPATTALRKLGALAFGSRLQAAYSEVDVIFLQQVARLVAVAVDNALHFEQAQSVQDQLKASATA